MSLDSHEWFYENYNDGLSKSSKPELHYYQIFENFGDKKFGCCQNFSVETFIMIIFVNVIKVSLY